MGLVLDNLELSGSTAGMPVNVAITKRGAAPGADDWKTAFRRFSRWSAKEVWWRMFEAMPDDPDFKYLVIDSTVVRAHQHAAGAKKEV